MSTQEIPPFDFKLLSKQYSNDYIEQLAICITENARSASGVPVNIPPTAHLVKALFEQFVAWGWKPPAPQKELWPK